MALENGTCRTICYALAMKEDSLYTAWNTHRRVCR